MNGCTHVTVYVVYCTSLVAVADQRGDPLFVGFMLLYGAV